MKRSWLIGGGVFLFVLLISIVAMFFSRQSNVIVAHDPNPKAASTSTVVVGTTTATPIPLPIVEGTSTYVFNFAPIDTSTYNMKLLALANLPVVTRTFRVSSTLPGSSTIVYHDIVVTSSAVTGWPVKSAPHPLPGALLPFNRIVAYYGNLYSTQMGVLGQYPPAQVLSMLESTTAMWAAADPSTPVIPALDYIAVTAQGSPGPDGDYRDRMPDSQLDEVMNMANDVHGLVFLDVQVGLSTVEKEVPLLEKYLAMPNVELSLDPEFDMHNGERPGTVIGTMDASDINWAAQYLANLVTQDNLPPKILVVHRFTDDMVTHTSEIQPLPQVQIVMDMDGFGFPAKKIDTYEQVIVPYPVQFTGFKLFYHNDTLGPMGRLMTPEEVLQLSPQPSYIQYQ